MPFLPGLAWEGWSCLGCTQEPKIAHSDNSDCAAGSRAFLAAGEGLNGASHRQTSTYLFCVNVKSRVVFFNNNCCISVITLVSFLESIPNHKNFASGIAFNLSSIQNMWVKPSGNHINIVG